MRINSAEERLLEEKIYEQVTSELSNDNKRNGLWVKALANSNYSENIAKSLYIKYRVQSIKDEMEIHSASASARDEMDIYNVRARARAEQSEKNFINKMRTASNIIKEEPKKEKNVVDSSSKKLIIIMMVLVLILLIVFS